MSHPHGGADAGVALSALWGSLRLAVLDTETCNAGDGDHIIDIAVITCRRHVEVGRWERKLNPGVPIDARTQETHGITDEEVVGADPFAAVEAELTRVLAPNDGEQLVLVAHNTTFDVSRLRLEYERAGRQLPDLPVLDTRALAKHLHLPAGSLASLLAPLNIVNAKPHSAAGDATATARAVMAMLVLAAQAGEQDFDALLAQAMRGRRTRTSTIAAAGRSRYRATPEQDQPGIDLPAEHVLGHAELLPDAPTNDELAVWAGQVQECAALRCPYLRDRVDVAPLSSAEVLALLSPALDRALSRPDPAAVATLLGALETNLGALPGRPAALRWHKQWGARLAGAGACAADDGCPSCRAGQPCPLDTWHHQLATAALGPIDGTRQSAASFLNTKGADSGKGVFTTWRAKGHARLADYAAWLVHEHWRTIDQHANAEAVARYAWQAGGRDPRLAAVHARNVAAAGGVKQLQRGLDVCGEALLSRAGSTDDGWRDLLATRGRLSGKLARRSFRPSGQVDEDGNPIAVRRHHPETPERTRRPRFTPHQ